MDEDLISETELAGNLECLTAEQRTTRQTMIQMGLKLPRKWLREDAEGVDADAGGRIATGIYNILTESGGADPRFQHLDTWQLASSFADVLRSGGDAYLWSLIRIALAECLDDDDIAELCEDRGFMVRLPRRNPRLRT